MKYKRKARFEGPGISGVTNIIHHGNYSIATNLGTFLWDGKEWIWAAKPDVQLFPIEKESGVVK